MASTEALSGVALDRQQAVGLDLGLTFQPIHAPLFRIISLKYLLPLRLGFTVKNVVQPEYRGDRFPVSSAGGLAYRWILADWIPESWSTPRAWLDGCQVLMIYDQEFMAHREMGSYFGMENDPARAGHPGGAHASYGPQQPNRVHFVGLGLQLPFGEKALFRVDYATACIPISRRTTDFS